MEQLGSNNVKRQKDTPALENVEVSYKMIDEHPAKADRLFKVMMRLEFALKEKGYCRVKNSQSLQVAWDKFAKECLDSDFFKKINAGGTADVLIKTPPKRQIRDTEGRLTWEESGVVSNTQELIGSLRRVRNNLFHGGKSGDPDRDRNDELVRAALCVIDAILQYNDDLRTIFEGKY